MKLVLFHLGQHNPLWEGALLGDRIANPLPAMCVQLVEVMDTLIRGTSAHAQALGQSMASVVQACLQVWLFQSSVPDQDCMTLGECTISEQDGQVNITHKERECVLWGVCYVLHGDMAAWQCSVHYSELSRLSAGAGGQQLHQERQEERRGSRYLSEQCEQWTDIELLAVSHRPYYLPREFPQAIMLVVYIPC